jgi:hypothetical protein
LVQENDIHVDLPDIKTFLSFSETDTEKSKFCSIEVLDETADSKASFVNFEYSSQKVSDWDKASLSTCCWGQEIL